MTAESERTEAFDARFAACAGGSVAAHDPAGAVLAAIDVVYVVAPGLWVSQRHPQA